MVGIDGELAGKRSGLWRGRWAHAAVTMPVLDNTEHVVLVDERANDLLVAFGDEQPQAEVAQLLLPPRAACAFGHGVMSMSSAA
jgi:hypothetical protein